MTPISEECYDLAGNLFGAWVFIDAARRHAAVQAACKGWETRKQNK